MIIVNKSVTGYNNKKRGGGSQESLPLNYKMEGVKIADLIFVEEDIPVLEQALESLKAIKKLKEENEK